jgi:hypothetical protein
MTLWFHPLCAAYKRPQSLVDAPDQQTDAGVSDQDVLRRAALTSVEHPRIPRIDGAEKSRSGQAKCRHCQEPIEKESWRIRIVFYEEGRFAPGGYIHLRCRTAYFETDDVLAPVLQFSPALNEAERAELTGAFATESPG